MLTVTKMEFEKDKTSPDNLDFTGFSYWLPDNIPTSGFPGFSPVRWNEEFDKSEHILEKGTPEATIAPPRDNLYLDKGLINESIPVGGKSPADVNSENENNFPILPSNNLSFVEKKSEKTCKERVRSISPGIKKKKRKSVSKLTPPTGQRGRKIKSRFSNQKHSLNVSHKELSSQVDDEVEENLKMETPLAEEHNSMLQDIKLSCEKVPSDAENVDNISEHTRSPATTPFNKEVDLLVNRLQPVLKLVKLPESLSPPKVDEVVNNVPDHASTLEQVSVSSEKTEELPDKSVFFEPFGKGWKREINTIQGNASVVYIHPLGLRLKDMEDVSQHLTDGLSLSNFTFSPEPLNAGPDEEVIVPETKLDEIVMEKDEAPKALPEVATPPVRKSGRVPVPSSNYKLKASAEASDEGGRRKPTEGKKRLIVKLRTTKLPKQDKQHSHRVFDINTSTEETTPRWQSTKKNKSLNSSAGELDYELNCTMKCPSAVDEIPSLQCNLCLRLFHPVCVGISKPISDVYICTSCRPQEDEKPAAAVTMIAQAGAGAGAGADGGPPYPFPFPPPPAVPQFIFIEHFNNRQFIVVPKLSLVAGQTPTPAPQIAAGPLVKGKQKRPRKKPNATPAANKSIVGDTSASYDVLLQVVGYLAMPDRLNVAKASRFLHRLTLDHNLWREVRMRHRITNWTALSCALGRGGTQLLDLTHMLNRPSADEWLSIVQVLRRVPTLHTLLLPVIPPACCLAALATPTLQVFHCEIGRDASLGLAVTEASSLVEIKIKFLTVNEISKLELNPLQHCLRKLSLLHARWDNVNLESLGQLSQLTELELGECSGIPKEFPLLLTKLKNLARIRLESCNKSCPTVHILNSLALLPNLHVLELINFDGSDMEYPIARLTTLRSLLLVPQFDVQGATKSQSVLKGLYNLKDSLLELAWVFTKEFVQIALLRNTTTANATNECSVPMLMPLPVPQDTSANRAKWSDLKARYSMEGQFAVVPITELQDMLAAAMPGTRTLVSAIAYSETAEQYINRLLPRIPTK